MYSRKPVTKSNFYDETWTISWNMEPPHLVIKRVLTYSKHCSSIKISLFSICLKWESFFKNGIVIYNYQFLCTWNLWEEKNYVGSLEAVSEEISSPHTHTPHSSTLTKAWRLKVSTNYFLWLTTKISKMNYNQVRPRLVVFGIECSTWLCRSNIYLEYRNFKFVTKDAK